MNVGLWKHAEICEFLLKISELFSQQGEKTLHPTLSISILGLLSLSAAWVSLPHCRQHHESENGTLTWVAWPASHTLKDTPWTFFFSLSTSCENMFFLSLSYILNKPPEHTITQKQTYCLPAKPGSYHGLQQQPRGPDQGHKLKRFQGQMSNVLSHCVCVISFMFILLSRPLRSANRMILDIPGSRLKRWPSFFSCCPESLECFTISYQKFLDTFYI